MTKSAYQFLLHLPVLMIVYIAFSLIGAVKFLGDDSLVGILPYHQVAALSSAVLLLALTSGAIGGGLYALAHSDTNNIPPMLRIARLIWTVLCVLTVMAGLFGGLEGRAGLELTPLLDVLLLAACALVLISIVTGVQRWTGLPLVFTFGLIALMAGVILSLIPADFTQDQLLRVIAITLRDWLGLGWMAIALSLWTVKRFSSLTPEWVETAFGSTGGLWAIAAYFIGTQALIPLGINPIIPPVIGVVALPLIALILASHLDLGLSNHNGARTLSGHWISLTAVLLLIGVGFLGALNAIPDVNRLIAGTRLTDLMRTLILFAFAAAFLGVTNQVIAELRREDRRITGKAPFWLISGGVLLGSAGLAGAGVIQVILERQLMIGYLETQALMTPLYTVWVIGWIAAAVGIVFYGLGVWARRIKSQR